MTVKRKIAVMEVMMKRTQVVIALGKSMSTKIKIKIKGMKKITLYLLMGDFPKSQNIFYT